MPAVTTQPHASADAGPRLTAAPTNPFEEDISLLFADIAELLGNPRSYGLIYGLLFASPTPLTMDAIVSALGISKGSASMGLRQLEEFGAITRSKPDRADTGSNNALYAARLELKPLIGGFLHSRVIPKMASTGQTIARIRDDLPHDAGTVPLERLDRLERWHKKAMTLLPLVQKLLGGS